MEEIQRKLHPSIIKLKAICKERNLSQPKLAKLADISEQTVEAWMEGRRSPTLAYFEKALVCVGYHLEIVKNEKKSTVEDVADQWCCDNCIYYENCSGSRSECVEHARRYWT